MELEIEEVEGNFRVRVKGTLVEKSTDSTFNLEGGFTVPVAECLHESTRLNTTHAQTSHMVEKMFRPMRLQLVHGLRDAIIAGIAQTLRGHGEATGSATADAAATPIAEGVVPAPREALVCEVMGHDFHYYNGINSCSRPGCDVVKPED